jgi:hypothetical protein
MTTYLHSLTNSLPGNFPQDDDRICVTPCSGICEICTRHSFITEIHQSTGNFFPNFGRISSKFDLFAALCGDGWRRKDNDAEALAPLPRKQSPHARTARILLSLLLPGHLIFVYATCLIESTVLPSALFLLAYLSAATAQVTILSLLSFSFLPLCFFLSLSSSVVSAPS